MDFINTLPSSFNVQYTAQVTKKAKTWQDAKCLIKDKKENGRISVAIIDEETNSIVKSGFLSILELKSMKEGEEVCIFGRSIFLRLSDGNEYVVEEEKSIPNTFYKTFNDVPRSSLNVDKERRLCSGMPCLHYISIP